MRRLPKIVSPRLLRTAVSLAARAASAEASIAGPVCMRVRDSLVLRVVKQKPAAGSRTDEYRAR